jgi:hypothetical protein
MQFYGNQHHQRYYQTMFYIKHWMKQDVKYFLKIVPPGIIQFLPSQGSLYSKHAINSPHLAALHFTGSTPVKILKIKKKGIQTIME